MALSLSQLNTVVREEIAPGVVDLNFKNDPLLAFLKNNVSVIFPGGASDSNGAIREVFMYQGLPSGTYVYTGAVTFSNTEQEILNATEFDPKHYYVGINVRKERVEVYNRGPNSVVDILDAEFQAAALQMNEDLAKDLYNYGQDKSGSGGSDRTQNLNGLEEAIGNATTAGWTDQLFAAYGNVTRSDVSGALDGHVVDNGTNPITFAVLEENYSLAEVGPESPNLGVTSNLGMAKIKSAFQPQQIITEVEPTIGFRGLKFNNATIVKSQYSPSDAAGAEQSAGGDGEVLYFLNTNYWRFWITGSEEFAFGFSGFKPAQFNNILAGQYFFAGNVTCQNPNFQVQIHDFD